MLDPLARKHAIEEDSEHPVPWVFFEYIILDANGLKDPLPGRCKRSVASFLSRPPPVIRTLLGW